MYAIQTSSLTKYYGSSKGIEDLRLTVEQGDFFGFIGPNGAGKSTTIRTLLGLISPTSGTARIFGKDIVTQKQEILSDIGYMPSESAFYQNQRVKDILTFSAALRKKDCTAQTALLCERFSLDPNRKIRELSLGNRKKVSIVCALQHMPSLYILDEPTNGLDPLMQQEFYAVLEERNRQGATIFLSSHVLSEVQKRCTHAAVIREGALLISDRMDALGHASAKQVTVRGVDALPASDQIRNVQKTGDTLRFLYSGSPKDLLQTLSALPLTDLSIAEPNLEEIFMHYYAKENP